jgi:hypothetical protein
LGLSLAGLACTSRPIAALALAPFSSLSQADAPTQGPLSAPRTSGLPSLLVYNTAQGLLAGDLEHDVLLPAVQSALSAFPAGWVVYGVGTTNQEGRTGELIPDGTAEDVRFWWADPSSPSQADIVDLAAAPGLSGVGLPFAAIGVGNPSSASEWPLSDVPDVHAWLKQQPAAADVQLAALHIEGSFGPVMTTVSYNIPPDGIPSGSVYSGDSFFRFGSYPSGSWVLDGVYAAAAALQPVISTAGNPLHLHGFQPSERLGGHIVSAAAAWATATVYPLAQALVRPSGFAVFSDTAAA